MELQLFSVGTGKEVYLRCETAEIPEPVPNQGHVWTAPCLQRRSEASPSPSVK